jgi:hypothetical protein
VTGNVALRLGGSVARENPGSREIMSGIVTAFAEFRRARSAGFNCPSVCGKYIDEI